MENWKDKECEFTKQRNNKDLDYVDENMIVSNT